MRERALEYRPKMIVAGYSSYPRILDFAAFAEIAREVEAYLLVDMAHFACLVAGGVTRPGSPRRLRDLHQPQDDARTVGRGDPVPHRACRPDRQGRLPERPGRPHCTRLPPRR